MAANYFNTISPYCNKLTSASFELIAVIRYLRIFVRFSIRGLNFGNLFLFCLLGKMSAKPVIKTSELSPELSERALRIAVDATEIESTEQVSKKH